MGSNIKGEWWEQLNTSLQCREEYARTNKYWGSGTYYCFASGAPVAKMVNTQESAMRDLTGISCEDCYKELTKQGFAAVPTKEVRKWFNENKKQG